MGEEMKMNKAVEIEKKTLWEDRERIESLNFHRVIERI